MKPFRHLRFLSFTIITVRRELGRGPGFDSLPTGGKGTANSSPLWISPKLLGRKPRSSRLSSYSILSILSRSRPRGLSA